MQTDEDWRNAGCPAEWCAECGCGLERVVFRHLPTCRRGVAVDMPALQALAAGTPAPADPGTHATALQLMARAEKAEQALASTRATLAQHVDENLDLHRRVAHLEDTVADKAIAYDMAAQRADTAEARVIELETDVTRLRVRMERAIGYASHVGHDEKRALAFVLEVLRG